MSKRAELQNLRCERKIEQEKTNATTVARTKEIAGAARALVLPVALAFVMMLSALAAPAAAVDINLSVITDVINAFIDLIEPLTNLLVAIVPLWFIIQILGFIMGILAGILAMIKFGRQF